MKTLINNIKNLLQENLSTTQRGLLITAILCKDINEKVTLAKFKTFVNVKNFRKDLIYLHENKFIKWSGYKTAIKAEGKLKQNPLIHDAITFMNQLYKRGFKSDSESTISGLRARLKDYSIEDVKLVIANRYEEWKDDVQMEKHLNPTTIFRKSKFEKYIEEATRTQKGSGIVSVFKHNLKNGDEINNTNVQSFSNNDLYKVKTYQIDSLGKRVGNGKTSQFSGSVLKRMLNIQKNIEKRNGNPNEIYIFVEK